MYRKLNWLTIIALLTVTAMFGVLWAPPTVAQTPEAENVTPEPTTENGKLAAFITAQFAEWNPVITAEALYENLTDGDETNDPFILSVRKPEDYAKGHIPGAYNIFWKEIVKPENLAKLPTDRQIVTYCYSGHTGEAAATFLRLLGYDVTNLKYGMMGWTDDLEVLAQEPFTEAAGYPVETEPNEPTEMYEPPVLETGLTDVVEIVKARGLEVFPEWNSVLGADAIYENLTDGDDENNPFIISVRKSEDYAKGHVPTAVNVFWKDVVKDLTQYPTDRQIVTYCYSGHTGEAAATALALLGYDVTNMKFGIMAWTDDLEVLAQEPFTEPAGYPVETEPNEL